MRSHIRFSFGSLALAAALAAALGVLACQIPRTAPAGSKAPQAEADDETFVDDEKESNAGDDTLSEEPSAQVAVLAPDKRENPAPALVRSKNGATLSTVGTFDVGLNGESSRNPKQIADALHKFILADRASFGMTAADDVALTVDSIEPIDVAIHVAMLDQRVGVLRVLDADMTATFTSAGYLQSLNGLVVPNRSPGAKLSLDISKVLSLLQGQVKPTSLGEVDAFEVDKTGRSIRADGASIEGGWSRAWNRPVWKAFLPHDVIWIDDTTGKVLRRETQLDPLTAFDTTLCRVRHRNWPRAADGRAVELNEDSTEPTLVSRITCEGDNWFGTCYWQLKRNPFGFPHGIARIDDMNGGEQEDAQSCDSSTLPSFTGKNGDALREQGAFYIANQMRHFINQNVWSQVAPNRDANVDIHLDDPNVSTAVFDDFFTSINASQGNGQQQVLMHEYGHYVVWTYDDVSDNCDPGTDEGDSLDETLANVFAIVYARDSEDIKPIYGALGGFALGNGPAPHTNDASILTQNIACAAAHDPSDGQAFIQAIWELLFNRNCSTTPATNTNGQGNQIWVGESTEAVITHVGAALGFALKALSQNITHSQVRAQMITKITSDSGNATAQRALAVFSHHGI